MHSCGAGLTGRARVHPSPCHFPFQGHCVKITIASGKGGTGKTTIATSLVQAARERGRTVCYVDSDVEEPNGHLFLSPDMRASRVSSIPVPVIDDERCTACGECTAVCQFGALARLGPKVLVFSELCHGCGGCERVCPVDAITEAPNPIGLVEVGAADGVTFVHGRLDIGQAMSPPLIRDVLREIKPADDTGVVLIDAPPGTSCPAVTAMHGADFVLLVTEPTPFGLNDLELAVEAVTKLGCPSAVVVNRHTEGNDAAREFCSRRGLRVVGEIPDSREVAEVYSRGNMPYRVVEGYRASILAIWDALMDITEGTVREAE